MEYDIYELLEELKLLLLSIPEEAIDTDAVDSFVSNALEPAITKCKADSTKAFENTVEMGAIGCTIRHLESRNETEAKAALAYLKSIYREPTMVPKSVDTKSCNI